MKTTNKKNRFRRILTFNLVEITLAIGVIAFGMTSVVTMCLTGLNQGRHAVGESMAAGIAENIFGLMGAIGKLDTSWSNGILLYLFDPNQKGQTPSESEKLTCGIQAGRMQTYKQTAEPPVKGYVGSDPKMHMEYLGNINAGENQGSHGLWICRIYSGTKDEARVEFSAFVKVWFAGQPTAAAAGLGGIGNGYGIPYIYQYVEKDKNTENEREVMWDMGVSRADNDDAHSYAGQYIEVSWPINQPLAKRQKRVFYKEIDE